MPTSLCHNITASVASTVTSGFSSVKCWNRNSRCLSRSAASSAKRLCKKLRITVQNKGHVEEMWGKEGAVEISIPTLIDDYNHWMGGVDLADQQIAYYHPNLRCRINWIPMFIQVLSLIRNNTYIVHNETYGKQAKEHKKHVYEMIHYLMEQAHKYYEVVDSKSMSSVQSCLSTISTYKDSTPPDFNRKRAASKSHSSRSSTSKRCLSNYPRRKHNPNEMHVRVLHKDSLHQNQSSYVYCWIEFARKKKEGVRVNWDKDMK